ncbi:MAG: Trk system potassium transporter TrkA [Bacteroidota bacterium]|nr:Trk system potassium transporter TrkA [Bacteroidota bacterium]
MDIIIAGAGDAGTYLAELLYNNNDNITIIDIEPSRLSYIDEHNDYLSVKGSANSILCLKEAGAEKCDLFIAMTNTEESNILSAVLAKKLGAKKVIARVSNKEYTEDSSVEFFNGLGIDSLVYPEILASEEIVESLNQAGASRSVEFAEGRLLLVALKLEPGAPVIGQNLEETTKNFTDFNFRAVAIGKMNKTVIPRGSYRFEEEDLVHVVCKKEALPQLMKISGIEDYDIKDVIIMGGSRIGYKTALALEKTHNVKIFERDAAKCEELTNILEHTLIINGDGRDTALLTEEGIDKVDAFIAVTGHSETNLLACLHAKKFGVKKTIAEIENMADLPLVQKMGINSIINKKLIAASHIYAHVLSKNLSSVHCLSSSDAEVLEYVVTENAKITNSKLSKIKFPEGAIIGGVIRGDDVFIAQGNTKIEVDDHVILFSLPNKIQKVSKLFK